MGVTVHYHGQLTDPERLEELEDLVIDLVLELGGNVEVWRSCSRENPDRAVRGLLVNLEPGQETMSLLFSPEGWLVPLFDIQAVENGATCEDASCFVKTQYGTPVGHAALVELLTILRDRYMPTLNVEDESGYWVHRDISKMVEAIRRNALAIDAMASALEETSLSDEALEDPAIVASRVERIAAIVHRRLQEQSATATEDDSSAEEFGKRWSEIEADWQELVRDSDAASHRRQRALEEKLLAGEDISKALEQVFEDELPTEAGSKDKTDGGFVETPSDLSAEFEEEFATEDDAFQNSLEERDPLLDRATQLYMQLMDLVKADESPQVVDLLRHAGEVCGGLAQALPLPAPYDFDPDERGLVVVQLKRALRGAAFLRGALLNLSRAAADDGEQYRKLREEVEAIQGEIIDSLQRARPAPDD